MFFFRLEEEKNILSEFQEDLNKLILWFEEADSIIGIPLESGNEDQLRDCLSKVKVLWVLFLVFSYFINWRKLNYIFREGFCHQIQHSFNFFR